MHDLRRWDRCIDRLGHVHRVRFRLLSEQQRLRHMRRLQRRPLPAPEQLDLVREDRQRHLRLGHGSDIGLSLRRRHVQRASGHRLYRLPGRHSELGGRLLVCELSCGLVLSGSCFHLHVVPKRIVHKQ